MSAEAGAEAGAAGRGAWSAAGIVAAARRLADQPAARALLILLALQAALAFALAAGDRRFEPFETEARLLSFDPAAIDAVEIADRVAPEDAAAADAEPRSVRLEKGAEGWAVAGLGGHPADAARIEALLARLAELKRGWPVARSAAGLGRLDLGATRHQRRVRLFAGGRVAATLELGASPAFRRVYARAGAETEAFNIAFPMFDAPPGPQNWTAPDALARQADDVAAISFADVRLIRAQDGYTLADLGPDESVDPAAVARVVEAALSPAVDRVLAPPSEAAETASPPAFELTLEIADGGVVGRRYRPLAVENGPEAEGPGLHRFDETGRAQSFEVDGRRIAALLDTRRADLLAAPEAAAPAADGAAPPPEDAALPPEDAAPATEDAALPPDGVAPATEDAALPPDGVAPATEGAALPPEDAAPAPEDPAPASAGSAPAAETVAPASEGGAQGAPGGADAASSASREAVPQAAPSGDEPAPVDEPTASGEGAADEAAGRDGALAAPQPRPQPSSSSTPGAPARLDPGALGRSGAATPEPANGVFED